MLQQKYPPALKSQSVGGCVLLWFLIDDAGAVHKVLLKVSSGVRALDDAALDVARDMRFTPALNYGQAVPVWVALPIDFRPADAPAEQPTGTAPTGSGL